MSQSKLSVSKQLSPLLQLLVFPVQAGKTNLLINDICTKYKHYVHTSIQPIFIVFTDNLTELAIQTSLRIERKIKNPSNDYIIRLSHQTKIKKDVSDYLLNQIREHSKCVIVCCSNKKRVEQINTFITRLQPDLPHKYVLYLYIDECDKNINLMRSKIDHWLSLHPYGPSGVTMITATPKEIVKKYGEVEVVPAAESFEPSTYHRFMENDFQDIAFIEEDDLDQVDSFFTKIIEHYKSMIQPDTRWFCPAKIRNTSHKAITSILTKAGFNVLTINQDNWTLYTMDSKNKSISEHIDVDDTLDMSQKIVDIYEKYDLIRNPFAIVGNLCIGRGLTFQSEKFLFTHSILAKISRSEDRIYQIAGRLCGNIKQFMNAAPPKVFCHPYVRETCEKLETYATTIPKNAFFSQNPILTIDYFD